MRARAVGSVSDAWVYTFKITDTGQAELDQCVKSKAGSSVSLILDEIFDVDVEFDIGTEAQLGRFYTIKTNLLKGDESELDQFLILAKTLSSRRLELRDLIGRELRQLSRIAQKDYRVA